MFPNSFDSIIYKNLHPDLNELTKEQLSKHYNNHGKDEGRKASKIHNRVTLKEFIDTNNLKCLEIGPFDDPVLKGKSVKYFDVLSQDDLKKRSKIHKRPNPIENIPFIDYINPKGDLSVVKEKFDIILSCHSIEHQLDFIKHLNDVQSLLKSNGRYVLIVPDKRYCFDHFIGESTIADVLEQHKTKSKIHLMKSVIEHRALTCHNNVGDHWEGKHGEQKYLKNPDFIENAMIEYMDSVKTDEYLDVHSLQFTPQSFERIITCLGQLNFTNMQIDQIYNTPKNSGEFYVVLKNKELPEEIKLMSKEDKTTP